MRYSEPTSRQLEEALALVFLAETKRALRNQEHISDMKLEIEVKYTIHNQRHYLIHASSGGRAITGSRGYYVHPAAGTPESAAWMLGIDARASAKKHAAAQSSGGYKASA